MYKLAGMLLLLTGCIGLGAEMVSEEKRRIAELRELYRIMTRIQKEMVYGKRTLPEICRLLEQCAKELYQRIFSEIYQDMERKDGVLLEKIWRARMEEGLNGSQLKEEEKSILLDLPVHLGILDESMQADDIGQSLDMVKEHIRQEERDYESKRKVIMSISITAGIFLVILLL